MLRDALGPALVGVYLHGSSALGDYHPSRSDIDILAVCAAALGAGERARLGAGLGRDALPSPRAPGSSSASSPGPRPATRPARPRTSCTAGTTTAGCAPDGGRGDPDLPLHFAVVRQIGLAVYGPPPAGVVREVPRDEQLRLVGDELDWTVAHASRSTQVMTACRAWALHADGRFRSKRDAAEWTLRHAAPPVVAEVLADHREARESAPDPQAVAAFVASVRTRLQHK